MRIGLLGGTFDPVHKGHLQLGKEALRQLKLSRVYFVLSPRSPFKSKKKITPLSIRLQLLKAALANKKEFSIGQWELKRKGPSYSVDTLASFKKRKPSSQLFLIMGSDLFPGFSRWKNPKKIKKMATLVVGVRPGAKAKRFPKGTFVLKGRFPNYSSSKIRGSLSNQMLKKMLPAKVRSLVKKKKLYQDD